MEEECERTEDEFLNIKLHCDSRTSSDDAFLENVLEISARGPHVVEIAQKGLQASSCTPAVKSLLFLWFGDKPESSILPIIRALCWQHAKMDTETDASFLAAVATTEYGSNGENETVRFSGTVNDLRVLILTLAALESGELEVGKAWSPVDGAIRLRRIPASASWRSARLKGEKVVYEMQGLAPDQVPSSIKLSRRQANALIDCLDCLIDISPSFGLGDSKNSPSQTILG